MQNCYFCAKTSWKWTLQRVISASFAFWSFNLFSGHLRAFCHKVCHKITFCDRVLSQISEKVTKPRVLWNVFEKFTRIMNNYNISITDRIPFLFWLSNMLMFSHLFFKMITNWLSRMRLDTLPSFCDNKVDLSRVAIGK